MKFIFASDLHLNREEKWTFDVLKEILFIASERGVSLVVFGGDIFDSFEDAKILLNDFNEVVENSSIDSLFLIPGNHDIKGGDIIAFSQLNFSQKVKSFCKIPYQILSLDNVEFCFVPFYEDLSLIFNEPPPLKRDNIKRFLIGHGSYGEFFYCDESENSFFDENILSYLGIDKSFLGHLHSRNADLKCGVFYPGSARVWRYKEYGERGVYLVNDKIEFIKIKSGGEIIDIKVDFEGSKHNMEEKELDPNSWIRFVFQGFVFTENYKEEVISELKSKYEKNVRRIHFDTNELLIIRDVIDHPVYKAYMEKWRERLKDVLNDEERLLYELARRYFLKEFSEFLERR